jgi:hypothetical protein
MRVRVSKREKNRVGRLRGRLSESDYLRSLVERDAQERNDQEPD